MKKKIFLFVSLLFLAGCSQKNSFDIQSKTFRSGMEFYLLENHTLPTTFYSITVKSGSVRDPAGKEGLANLTIKMLLRGTKNRNRSQILEDIDFLGAALSANVDYDYIQLVGKTLSRTQDRFFELLSDVLLNPTFPKEEFEKLKSETTGQLQLLTEDDRGLNRVRFTQWLYQGFPYGRLTTGTPSSIKNITLSDVKDFYQTHFLGSNMILAAAGDVEKSPIKEWVNQYMGSTREGKVEPYQYPQVPTIAKSRILLVDKPDRTQTQILVGQYGVSGDSADFYPLYVGNVSFGGTFTSTLMREIRVKRGWSYGAYSRFVRRKSAGEYFIWSFPANKDTLPTIDLTNKLLKDFIDKGVSKEEFELAKQFAVRETAFITETPDRTMGEFLDGLLKGWKGYPENLRKMFEKVSYKNVQNVIPEYLKTSPFVMTIVCTASDFKEALEKQFPDAEVKVVPYDQWDISI